MDTNFHTVTSLHKTWIFDLDGTIVKHNGYKIDGIDTLLDGASEFINSISPQDYILFLTARTEEQRIPTIEFLKKNKIRYDGIIFNAPHGERILVNDKKPSGLNMAYAINTNRDVFMKDRFIVDKDL